MQLLNADAPRDAQVNAMQLLNADTPRDAQANAMQLLMQMHQGMHKLMPCTY